MKLKTESRKKFRIRNKIKKVSKNDSFRLSVFRSARNLSAQIIDDKKTMGYLNLLGKNANRKNYSFQILNNQKKIIIYE